MNLQVVKELNTSVMKKTKSRERVHDVKSVSDVLLTDLS